MPKRNDKKIKVVELFAGVGGFRIGLEGASDAFETVWNNQWEPSTVHQDASLVYRARFGSKGHSNKDINLVPTSDIPDHDLLVGGFPCQDYSVASTLSKSGGQERCAVVADISYTERERRVETKLCILRECRPTVGVAGKTERA